MKQIIALALCLLGMAPLARAQGPQLMLQTGPTSALTATAFSRDGRLQATGETGGVVRIWDWESGAELRHVKLGDSAVTALAFSQSGASLLCGAGKRGMVIETASGQIPASASGVGTVNAARWSPDGGSFLLAGEGMVNLYDTGGRRIDSLQGHDGPVYDAVFSPDGNWILTGGADKTALLFDAHNGQLKQSFEDNGDAVTCVAIAPDSSRALLGLRSRNIRVMDLNSGQQIRQFALSGEPVSLRFARDGQSFLVAASGDATRWLDLEGAEKARYAGFVAGADFDAENTCAATAEPFKAHLWNVKDGTEAATCQGRATEVFGTAFSPDGKLLASAHGDGGVQVFSLVDGGAHRFDLQTERAICVAFSPDNSRILAGGDRGALLLFDLASGKTLFSLAGHTGSVLGVAVSGDGKTLLSAGEDGTLKFWNAADGTLLESVVADKDGLNVLKLDAKGERALAGGADGNCRIWEIASRKVVCQTSEARGHVLAAAWAPDGKTFVAGGDGQGSATVFDAQTGKPIRALRAGVVWALAWPKTSAQIYATGPEASLRVFDESGKAREVTRFESACAPLTFSPDGRLLAASGVDGLVRLWDVGGAKNLCVLASLKGGDWAIIDGAGRFDTSLVGRGAATTEAGLLWSYQLSPIGLDQFRAGFQVPTLLARLTNADAQPLADLPTTGAIELFPLVAVAAPSAGESAAVIQLRDMGGGIGPVQIWLNDKFVVPDARGALTPQGGTLGLRYVPDAALLAPDNWNTLRVVAQNSKGTLASLPTEVRWKLSAEPDAKGAPVKVAPPRFFALVAGVSVYANPQYNLKVAAKDARDMASALEVSGRRLFTPERMKIWLLTGEDAVTANAPGGIARLPATKANFEAAFKQIREQAKPGDVVMLYFAGHGGLMGQGRNVYFYLTQEAKNADISDARWGSWTITADDITDWLSHVAARKTVVILDTCFSGNAAQSLGQARAAGVSQQRAFEKLQNTSGSHVLAGCAQNNQSYEDTRYNQGLLTYALLEGMRGAALKRTAEGEVLDVDDWFGYANRRVPELARSVGRIQLPQSLSPTGASFPLGVLNEADKNAVPLRPQVPVITRPRLRDETAGDSLGLEPLLNAALHDPASSAGVPFVMLDTSGEVEGVFKLSGGYRQDGNMVSWNMQLTRDGKVFRTIEDSGIATDVPALISKMAVRLRRVILETPAVLRANE